MGGKDLGRERLTQVPILFTCYRRDTCVSSWPPGRARTAPAHPTHPQPHPRGQDDPDKGERVSTRAETLSQQHGALRVPAQDMELGQVLSLLSKHSYLCTPRSPGPPTCHCLVSPRLIAQLGGVSFHLPFSMSPSQSLSLHPSTHTPTCNIQQLLPCENNPCLSSVAPTSLLLHL